MKKLLTMLAVAVAATLATPKAEAGRTHVSVTIRTGTASCGCPIYSKRYVRGYDCYRRPVYGYTRLSFRHNTRYCRHHRPSHYHRPVPCARTPIYYSRSRVVVPRYTRSYSHSRSHGRRCR